MKRAMSEDSEPDELHASTVKPTETQTPKICASSALVTPLDDDVSDCNTKHDAPVSRRPCVRRCQPCTEANYKALQDTDLAYHLVFSSTQALDLFAAGGSTVGGRQVYKLVKCGSREAAVAEIFHATGTNGWNLVFSCVTRASEDIMERGGKFTRVKNLWMLADDDGDDGESVRVFY